MRSFQIVVAALALTALCCCGADTLRTFAYDAGEATGYNDGWIRGSVAGYAAGYNDGKADAVVIVTCDCREAEARGALEFGLDWSERWSPGESGVLDGDGQSWGIATVSSLGVVFPDQVVLEPGEACQHQLQVVTAAYWTDGIDRNRVTCSLCGEVLNELGEERGR